MKKVRFYEIDGHRYTTHDLTFDQAYWQMKGVTRLLPLTSVPAQKPRLLLRDFWKKDPVILRESPLPYVEKIDEERVAQASLRTCEIPQGRALLDQELDFLLTAGWRDAMQILILEGKAQVLPGVNLRKSDATAADRNSFSIALVLPMKGNAPIVKHVSPWAVPKPAHLFITFPLEIIKQFHSPRKQVLSIGQVS